MTTTSVSSVVLSGLFVVLVGISVVVAMNIVMRPPPTTPMDIKTMEAGPKRTNFGVFNYLPNHYIRLDVLSADGQQIKLLDAVPPVTADGLTKAQVIRQLVPGNYIRIYLVNKNGKNPKHFADYLLDYEKLDRIKNLHIGMVTTRFIGTTTDNLRLTTNTSNATGGNAWLKFHNLTENPIRLNEGEIVVPPHTVYRYLGQFNQGVALGMTFVDNDGVYPDFFYTKPQSDIYYGVVSDIRQPLQGCFQLEYNDACEYGQTLWPFEDGVV